MQRKDVERLAQQADALLEMDAKGALVPHGVGGLARSVISQQTAALRTLLAERDALQGQLNDLRNGWANSVKAHAALLAERGAAFAAGQEEMRERAAETSKWYSDRLVKAIRALPLKGEAR